MTERRTDAWKSKVVIVAGTSKETLTEEGGGDAAVGDEGGWENMGLQETSRVMCCQNIWVTKSCPATQTIEAKTGRPGNVGPNILPALQLFQVCSDPSEEMTSATDRK